MIKQISLVALVAIGIGTLFLGMGLAPTFAALPPRCTGDPHGEGANPLTGNPHPGETGNPHTGFGFPVCPGTK